MSLLTVDDLRVHLFTPRGVVQAVDRLGLDGMLALWRPASAN